MKKSILSNNAQEYFDQYWQHASTLRAWFVGYGVGAVALLVSHKDCMASNPHARSLFAKFIFIAVVFQVGLAFINKVAHWLVYWGYEDEDFRNTKLYQSGVKVVSWFWLDVLLDLATFVFYVIAAVIFMVNL